MFRPRKRLLAAAAAAMLALTIGVGLPASAEPVPGTVTGHLTDGGAPVPSASVTVMDPATFQAYFAQTDASGAFTVSNVAAGTYRVEFRLPGNAVQYAVQQTTAAQADLITVTEGGVVTVDEEVLPHGSISGRLTRADGSPVANRFVTARADGSAAVPASIGTDANGAYHLPVVWPGTYVVSFGGFGTMTQYAHGKTSPETADRFEIAAGAAVTVDETLLPVGAIAGQLTTSAGQPVAFAQVTVREQNGGAVGFGSTQSDGRYRVEVSPGTYTVEFRPQGGQVQYAHQKRRQSEADLITVAAGPDTIVDEQLLAVGTIEGRLVDAAGAPVPFVFLRVIDDAGGIAAIGFTSFDGTFRTQAPPGVYKVVFVTPLGEQWARGKSSAETADPIVVTGGQVTRLDEALVPTGTIVLTARDRTTGAPVTRFCAFTVQSACTEDGTVTLPSLPGTYHVSMFGAFAGEQAYADQHVEGVTVTSGQSTSVVADLTRAASVRAVIRDAATGEPVEGACIALVEPLRPTDLEQGGPCSGPDGIVVATQLRPSVYNVFVFAFDGFHGHQWVGYRGGTGAQVTGRLVPVQEGATVTIPDIKLDRAGTLTGVVTSSTTGEPLKFTQISVSSSHGRRGGGGPSAIADEDGHYTFEGLGPYDWTLFAYHEAHAAQFNGGVANRFLAQGTPVRAGQTTTYNIALSKGTTLVINLIGPPGQPATEGDVVIVNALTGDEMGRAIPDVDPRYQRQVTAPQLVKLRLEGFGGEPTWVGGSDFVHAKVFLIPATDSKTIDVKVP